MKNLTTLFLFLSVFSFTLTAQVSEEEMNDLLNSREIKVDNPMINNFLMIRQISDNNEIISIQDNPGNAQNTILINQNGTGNKGYVEQKGAGLETHLWQYNSSNTASLKSEGNNVTFVVKQNGNKNVIDSDISNFNLESRTAMLLQNGDENRIELNLRESGVPESFEPQEFKITQTGNNHEATITGIDFNSPITIDQTGGTGMQIEINTSYFTFPMGN